MSVYVRRRMRRTGLILVRGMQSLGPQMNTPMLREIKIMKVSVQEGRN